MSAAFGNLREDAGAWGAQLALSRLRDGVATTGTGAMRACSGLLAEVDQHAAAVRDALIEVSGKVSVIGLAAYADGVSDAAARNGWQLPEAPEWASPSWPQLRLLAVCVLAETAGLI
jgi:hypothetical protein